MCPKVSIQVAFDGFCATLFLAAGLVYCEAGSTEQVQHMNIIYYSTNSNQFNPEDFSIRSLPSKASEWDSLAQKYPEHTFFIYTQLPGTFLIDLDGGEVSPRSTSVSYTLSDETDAEKIAEEILALHPDIAIAATFWVTPYDWLGMKDAMVADLLREQGVQTICHPLSTQAVFFDKAESHRVLKAMGITVPKAVFFHHELYRTERSHKELKTNVYKEYLHGEIERLHYPLVIKPTTGMSSYGMEVARTFKETCVFLHSGRTNGDRIIEEYVDGIQFGCEIYGADGQYTVMPPFAFSLTKYGITSPKQSEKLGPFPLPQELSSMLKKIASAYSFSGIAQADVILKEGKWYLLEINPRLSGMTETYAAGMGISTIELLLKIALAQPIPAERLRAVCNMKLPIPDDEAMKHMATVPCVQSIHRMHNLAAHQLRERGYAEIIFSCQNDNNGSIEHLMQEIEDFARAFPDFLEPIFLENARLLAAKH